MREGAFRRPSQRRSDEALGASVGSSNSPSCSSSIRSSSSSVPMRTGPLNHLFADRTHQPPNRSNARADEDRRVVHGLPGEAVLPTAR